MCKRADFGDPGFGVNTHLHAPTTKQNLQFTPIVKCIHTHFIHNNDTHKVGSRKFICKAISYQTGGEREPERERWLKGRRGKGSTPFSSWLIFPISSRHDRNLLQLKHHSGDRHCVCVSACMYAELMVEFIEWKIESNCVFQTVCSPPPPTPSLYLILISTLFLICSSLPSSTNPLSPLLDHISFFLSFKGLFQHHYCIPLYTIIGTSYPNWDQKSEHIFFLGCCGSGCFFWGGLSLVSTEESSFIMRHWFTVFSAL